MEELGEAATATASPSGLRVLNELFSIHSYTGSAEDERHGIEHILTPSLSPFHCSGPGVGHVLTLTRRADAPAVVITHIVLHGPPGCSEPLKSGQIWIAESAASLDDGQSPITAFETDSVKKEWSVALPSPATKVGAVRMRFDSTHGEGENVDVSMIALVGFLEADSPQPTPEVCSGKVPAELGVTDLKRIKKRKNWLPLESNPKVVTKYLRKLGFDSGITVNEMLSLEGWALEMIPRPVCAVLLLFPIGKETEAARNAEADVPPEIAVPDNVVHMKQLIGNACGTIALVHVMANMCKHGDVGVDEGSWLEKFLVSYRDGMTSDDVGTMLEEDVAIAEAHREAEAESEARNTRANANLHFVSFVAIKDFVVELDGRRERPIVRGRLQDHGGDFLKAAVVAIRENYMKISPDALRFNMMALSDSRHPVAAAGGGAAAASGALDEASVTQLVSMGFDEEAARTALEAAGGNVDAAVNFFFS